MADIQATTHHPSPKCGSARLIAGTNDGRSACLSAARRGLFACAGGGGGHTTVVTRPGLFEATPDVSFAVLPPGPAASAAALTGPDTGVTSVCGQPGAPGAAADPIPWQLPQAEGVAAQQQQQQQPSQQQQQAWGSAISLYDKKPATGQRNGEPIADCWAAITYQAGAVLALADGVSWGSRPRLAARAAVHGFCSHLHAELVVAQQSQGALAAARGRGEQRREKAAGVPATHRQLLEQETAAGVCVLSLCPCPVRDGLLSLPSTHTPPGRQPQPEQQRRICCHSRGSAGSAAAGPGSRGHAHHARGGSRV